jgi:thioredoxin 1
MRARRWTSAVIALAFSAGLLAAGPAGALERLAYTPELAAEAARAGRPYVIHIHADWCSTCQAQLRIMERLADDPRFRDLLVIAVDYDRQTDIMRRYGASERSTIIAFFGALETGRIVAETRFEALTRFLLSAVE